MESSRFLTVVGMVVLVLSGAQAQIGGYLSAAPLKLGPEKPLWLAVGPVTVKEGEEIGGVVVLGPAVIAGRVDGDVVSFGGKVTVAKTAVVAGDVTAVCGPVEVAEGAKVAGKVQAQALPEAALIDCGWPGLAKTLVVVGDQEFAPANTPARVVVVGGNVRVKKGAQLVELTALGGDVVVAKDAEVQRVHLLGGKLDRAERPGKDTDEVIAPALLVCEPAGPGTSGVVVRTTETFLQQTTQSGTLLLNSNSPWSGRGTIKVGASGLSAELELDAQAIHRAPLPEPKPAQPGAAPPGTNSGGGFAGGGYGGGARTPEVDRWPIVYHSATPSLEGLMYVARDRDPLFQHSTAVGARLSLTTTVTEDQGRETISRSIGLGIPPEMAGGPGPAAPPGPRGPSYPRNPYNF